MFFDRIFGLGSTAEAASDVPESETLADIEQPATLEQEKELVFQSIPQGTMQVEDDLGALAYIGRSLFEAGDPEFSAYADGNRPDRMELDFRLINANSTGIIKNSDGTEGWKRRTQYSVMYKDRPVKNCTITADTVKTALSSRISWSLENGDPKSTA